MNRFGLPLLKLLMPGRVLRLLLPGLLSAAAHSADRAPLFSTPNAAPLRIELAGPLETIARDEDPEPRSYAATLVLLDAGEQFTVALKPRGKSRRKQKHCRFPPLWVEMAKADAKETIFAGHYRHKLVTHCEALKRDGRNPSKVWIEMLAYRALNLLTERSFRVQPVSVVYRDTAEPAQTYEHPGFFIEHKKELARRLGLLDSKIESLRRAELEPQHANLNALFNMLIGNSDYSQTQAPPGDSCCHNSVPLLDANGIAYPVIYDFDNTGLVNPHYAAAPAALKIRTVKTRVYRGYCRHNELLAANLAQLAAKRTAIEALFSEHPEISDAEKRRVGQYLRQFFDRYAAAGRRPDRLARGCLG